MTKNQMPPVDDIINSIDKDCFDNILGYDYVKEEMVRWLKYVAYIESGAEWTEGFQCNIAFVGPEGASKGLMAESFADAYADIYELRHPEGKGCHFMRYRISHSMSESEMRDAISWMKGQSAAKKGQCDMVVLVISNVDLLTPEQVKDIQDMASGVSDKVFTVVSMKDSDCVSAKELYTFDIKVCEPSKSDSEAFLEYLIHEKYKDVSFGTDMEGLLDIFNGRPFGAVDVSLQHCIIKAASRNEDITPGMLVESALGVDVTSFRQYSLKERFESGRHLAGEMVLIAMHGDVYGDVLRGFAYLKGLKGDLYGNNRVTYNGNYDRETLYELLAGMAGDEICTGMKLRGSETRINNLKKLVIEDLTVSGIYGPQYLEFTGSEAQKKKIDRKASEIMEEMYRDTITMLSPYKELIVEIGHKIAMDGYILLSEARELLREFDNNRE